MKQDTDELIETCVSDVDLTIADAAEPAADTAPAPEEYSVLVLRNKVIFPGVLIPVTLGRQMSISLIEEALQKGLKIAVVCQKDQKITNPGAADIYTIGVLAHISRIIPEPGSNKVVLLQCEDRIRIDEITAEEPWLRAIVSHIPEEPASAADPETKAIADSLFKTAKQVLSDLDNGMEQIQLLSQLQGLDAGINHICSSFQSATEVMQSLLEESSMRTRADRMLRELHGFAVKQQVQKEIKIKTDQLIAKGQREYYLQQEIRAIREELGDTNDQQLQELRDRAERKEWTPEVKARFLEELRKLERIDPHMPDYSVQRTYLDLILDLPWGHLTVDNTSLPHAERVLNKDHFGMEEVKERILEYLASSRKSGMILCLWGPPVWARPRSDALSLRPLDANTPASPSAVCTTNRSSADIVAPTSAQCPDASSIPSRKLAHPIPSSFSTRLTKYQRIITATPLQLCSRFSIPSRTARSMTTTSI
ncbi:MAG: LON peptidase substrate-binding domain-containing protein [Bacteroidales bacterium]|nr:LON peptidase substrate-binding domain-containing protein [Candidatus Colicola faecequi]